MTRSSLPLDGETSQLDTWLATIDALRVAPEWAPSELPIEVIQTHISVVLLGNQHVLKLKKPVDFGFLDYTTLEKRLAACHAEVTLNSRLCPDVYIGVLPVGVVDGCPHIGTAGPPLDYGVWMRRLPDSLMLDRLVARGEVTEAMIDRIAERLCAFHHGARRGPDVDVGGSVEVIARNWDENFSQTLPFVTRTLSAEDASAIRRYVDAWLGAHETVLAERVRAGRVCDGHGDVRCESVCVENGISIFDCIEFNERFRFGDLAGEVAFLAMDLAVRGRPDLGYAFCERYEARSGDRGLFALLPFYRCYRAFVRGKVLSFQAAEPEVGAAERDEAAARAGGYFALAGRYASPLRRPTVVVVSGLSGTGKTSIARTIAQELGLRVVSADAVRKSLFEDTREVGYGEGPYSAAANRATYEKVLEEARRTVDEEGGVVLDATFRRVADRAATRAMAADAGARWRLVECRIPEEAVRARLERRAALGGGLSDATWETYLRQRGEFESVAALGEGPCLALDTSRDMASCGADACDWLRAVDTI
jgi:aminoglycoside phosphotransferase family enzyme/predicted kinase